MAQMSARQVHDADTRLIADAAKIRFFPLVVDRGEGCRIIDPDGKRYLDFSAAWALANTGYSHAYVRDAILSELDRSTFAGLVSGMHAPAVQLADKLVALVPGDFEQKVWFGLSGSDANETLGRLLPLATGKRRIVSFIGGYHGTTGTAMGMSAHIAMTPIIGGANVVKVPYPNPYRCPFGTTRPAECAERAIHFLEDYIFKTICPPDDVAGIILEPLQSDGGDVLPPPLFLPMLSDLCRRHDIYLAVDEVKVGMGRTGRMFAFEHAGVVPDAVVLGKSLGGGMPVSAVVARREILDVGFSVFSAMGNALGCAAALATIEAIEHDGLVEHAERAGAHLSRRLHGLAESCPLIGDVRGLGLFQGVELVRDRATREPATREAAKVCYRAFELGLILFYVGMASNVLEITPPLVISDAEIDEGVEILERALADVAAGRVSDEEIARFAGW